MDKNIKDGVTGKLIPVNDSDSLAKAIIWALENPKYIRLLAEAAKKEVRGKFSWNKTADSMVDIYTSVLRDKA
jgi:glycosyltransferase involved in cell wall biosynthesis